MVSIDSVVLNRIYELSLEFGVNFRRPILTIVQKVSPKLSFEEQKKISTYIEKTRRGIEAYFYERYVSDQPEMISALERQGAEWIKVEFPWMNPETIRHAISQAMYFAWHG